MEAAIRTIGQTSSCLGSNDPRLTAQGKTDFRRQLQAYSKRDPPPSRVKPLPVQVLRHVLAGASHSPCEKVKAIADSSCIAFFFLMRPGEYTAGAQDATPFRLQDVQLFLGSRRLPTATATPTDLHAATFVSYTFTTQKNGVRGEVIGLGPSGDPLLCPVRATARQILRARSVHAPLSSPVAGYPAGNAWRPVVPTDVTTALRVAVMALGPAALGFQPADVSSRSLRASGATALLCANVDSDTIRLVGRWRSDEMLRYLHVQAEPVMRGFARRMVSNGDFGALHPGPGIPVGHPPSS